MTWRRFDALSSRDLAAWRRLAAHAAEPNPFFEPEALLPAWRHMRERPVELLTVDDGDGWLAALPVERRIRYGKLPGPCRMVWEHAHCPLGTPLVASGRVAEAADALVGALTADRPAAWSGFRSLGEDGPVGAAVHAALARRRLRPIVIDRHQRAMLRAVDGKVGPAALRSDSRRQLARRERRLAESCGGPVDVATRAGDDEAVERFLVLEHAGWKGAAGTSLLGVPGHADFFREMCRELGGHDRVRFFELRAGGRVAAIQVSLRGADTEFFVKTAYDESLSSFGPGVLVALKAIERVGELPGAERVDGCSAPDNDVLNRLMPDRRAIATFAVARPGVAGLPARGVLPLGLRLRDRLRRRRA